MNWIASVIISCKNNLSNGEEICLISDGLEKIGIISFNNLSSVILLNLHEFLLTPLTDHHFTSWSWHMQKHTCTWKLRLFLCGHPQTGKFFTNSQKLQQLNTTHHHQINDSLSSLPLIQYLLEKELMMEILQYYSVNKMPYRLW